jgi:hypothetical protein
MFYSNAIKLQWEMNHCILMQDMQKRIVFTPQILQPVRISATQSEFNEKIQNILVNRQDKRLFAKWLNKDPQLLNKLFTELCS